LTIGAPYTQRQGKNAFASHVRAGTSGPFGSGYRLFIEQNIFVEGTMISLKKSIACSFVALMIGGGFSVTPASAAFRDAGGAKSLSREIVDFGGDASPGTIVINASQRRLFYVLGDGAAISYPVAVPKRGKEWSGVTSIRDKRENPDWTPPADVRMDHPELPEVIPGGSPNNPMGTHAMLLNNGTFAIHGTTSRMRASIGSAASYGCIRMRNEDVADLYRRVAVGATVIMQP
jgi:lipoprotein-anchoring transpeptidase ErfK/SrfK